jgi:hypothetical protein
MSKSTVHPVPRIPALRPGGWIALAMLRIIFLLGAQAAAAGILESRQAALPW